MVIVFWVTLYFKERIVFTLNIKRKYFIFKNKFLLPFKNLKDIKIVFKLN